MQSTFPSSPRSSGPPRNENAARIEDEAKPRVVEKPKRSSLGRLKTSKDEELLPQGFSIIVRGLSPSVVARIFADLSDDVFSASDTD